MSTEDEEFTKRLRATFQIEAEEHLQAIASGLLALEKSPSVPRQEAIDDIYREAHSLKGAVRHLQRAFDDRRAEAARLAAIARQRAIDQAMRNEVQTFIAKDDTTGEDPEVRRVADALGRGGLVPVEQHDAAGR